MKVHTNLLKLNVGTDLLKYTVLCVHIMTRQRKLQFYFSNNLLALTTEVREATKRCIHFSSTILNETSF